MNNYIEIENEFDEYQTAARETAIYPRDAAVTYPILGAIGELGEIANKYKKVIRDNAPIDREDLAHEIGDVLWYLSNICADLNISLGYVAVENLRKLHSRKERGTLQGSGDNR